MIDGFKKKFQSATSIRCFIRARKNLKTDLGMMNISVAYERLSTHEIYGQQVREVKYKALVDCGTTTEFEERL